MYHLSYFLVIGGALGTGSYFKVATRNKIGLEGFEDEEDDFFSEVESEAEEE